MFRTKPNYFYKKNFISIILTIFIPIYLFFFYFANVYIGKKKRYKGKTICVGNIVAGGSGKTPICLEIGKILSQNNSVCYITKGYGRNSKKEIIIPYQHKKLFNFIETGDEPILLSDVADVFVVNNRKQFKNDIYDYIIFDDGFFDNSIVKDINIVIFDSNFFIGNGFILPAGALKDRLKSLKKADFVVLTDPKDQIDKQIEILSKYIPSDKILTAKLKIDSEHSKIDSYLSISGIGNNQKFVDTIKKLNIKLVKSLFFEDHAIYDKKKIAIIEKEIKTNKIEKIITTSKDYVKLPKSFCEKYQVEVLKISYDIDNIEKIINYIKK